MSSNNKTVVNKLIKHWDTCEKQTIILFSYNKYNRYTLLIYINQTVFNVHYMNHECSIFKSIRFIEFGNVTVKYIKCFGFITTRQIHARFFTVFISFLSRLFWNIAKSTYKCKALSIVHLDLFLAISDTPSLLIDFCPYKWFCMGRILLPFCICGAVLVWCDPKVYGHHLRKTLIDRLLKLLKIVNLSVLIFNMKFQFTFHFAKFMVNFSWQW